MLPTIFLFFFLILELFPNLSSTTIQTLFVNETMTDINEQITSYSFSFLHAFFFLGVELCYFFFAFLFTPSFFFFWGCGVLLFSVLDIFLFLSGGRRICSSGFWSLFLVSYFLGPCVFSLSPSIAWTSSSEIDSSLFLAASLIVSMVTRS